jgi:hypothetical protein
MYFHLPIDKPSALIASCRQEMACAEIKKVFAPKANASRPIFGHCYDPIAKMDLASPMRSLFLSPEKVY